MNWKKMDMIQKLMMMWMMFVMDKLWVAQIQDWDCKGYIQVEVQIVLDIHILEVHILEEDADFVVADS